MAFMVQSVRVIAVASCDAAVVSVVCIADWPIGWLPESMNVAKN